MNMIGPRILPLAGVCLLPVVSSLNLQAAPDAQTQWYLLTDLGTLGGQSAQAYGINDSGQVVGHSLLSDPALGGHSFLQSGLSTTDLFPFDLGFGWSGKVINSLGQIAGSTHVNDVLVPAIYDRAGIQVLPSVGFGCGGYCAGNVTALNNLGQAAGWSSISDDLYHAVLWRNGIITDLGSFGAWSVANSLNDLGLVVGLSAYQGVSPDDNGVQHPFLYSEGTLIDLNQFGLISAVDINNRGQIAGAIEYADGFHHAALFAQGVTTDIHNTGIESDAAAINERGQIVGSFTVASGIGHYYDPATGGVTDYVIYSSHAFSHEQGVTRDLNSLIFQSLGWELQYAMDINNTGQIVGWGVHHDETRGFRLDPSTRIVIDIKPDEFPNVVKPNSKGLLPVAILSTDSFDASKVNASFVLFGVNGTEAAPSRKTMEDVNKDGRLDMLLHFRMDRTGIDWGDTTAILTGRLRDGRTVVGQDSIRCASKATM